MSFIFFIVFDLFKLFKHFLDFKYVLNLFQPLSLKQQAREINTPFRLLTSIKRY